jgi:hypothetical protein
MDLGFRQRLVDASLVRPQRTAALQKQGDALEWETVLMSREVWSKLEVHCVLSFFDEFGPFSSFVDSDRARVLCSV